MRRAAFSLLEVSVALAVLAIIGAAIMPLALSRAHASAADAAARDMAAILDAARNFYAAQPVSALRWPQDLAELQAAGYVPAGFTGLSPFGTPYTAAPDGARFTVSAEVPATVAPAVARLLPLATVSPSPGGARVAGAVPAPGLSADLSQVLHRGGTLVSSTMYGPLKIADGTQADGRVLTSDAEGVGRWAPAPGVPAGTVAFFDVLANDPNRPGNPCPDGWSPFAAGQGRYVVGLPSGGTLLAQVGTALGDQENRPVGAHTHAVNDPGHQHPVTVPTGAGGGGTSAREGGAPTGSVALTAGPAVTGVTIAPAGSVAGTNAPYVQLLACRKD
jgi:prepilin-type N-terminal cleavage/methylation domain-containing protein